MNTQLPELLAPELAAELRLVSKRIDFTTLMSERCCVGRSERLELKPVGRNLLTHKLQLLTQNENVNALRSELIVAPL